MSSDVFHATVVRRWAGLGVEILKSHRDELNALNVFPVPDGDTGTNLYLTFRAAAEAELTRSGRPDDVVDALSSLARGAVLGARGNSGVILAQVLQAFADSAATMGPPLRLSALLAAGAAAARAAVADPQEGTALSVLDAAAAVQPRDAHTAIDAAQAMLERTPDMLPVLKAAGVVDAGGRGVVLLLEALSAAWHGDGIVRDEPPVTAVTKNVGKCEPDAAYEIMFVCPARDVDSVSEVIVGSGVSLTVAQTHEIAQVHIHSNTPTVVIERAAEVTTPTFLRIESLNFQPSHRALVAAAYGVGNVVLLADVGAIIVGAEPDSRPSVQDFVVAAERSGAREIVLAPSDADSISVAHLAAQELEKRGFVAAVVPTRSLVETLSVAVVFDDSQEFADCVASMLSTLDHMDSWSVGVASRNASLEGQAVGAGDYIVMHHGSVVFSSVDLVDSLLYVVTEHCATRSLVTIVIGADVTENDSQDMLELLAEFHSHLEVEIVHGGQAMWPLIIGCE